MAFPPLKVTKLNLLCQGWGALHLIAGIEIFYGAPGSKSDRTTNAVGAIALIGLVALAVSPFFNRWFEDKMEARLLRQALYPRTLEALAYYMSICQMRSNKRIAAQLLAIWQKHGLEPGWSARPIQPLPLFK